MEEKVKYDGNTVFVRKSDAGQIKYKIVRKVISYVAPNGSYVELKALDRSLTNVSLILDMFEESISGDGDWQIKKIEPKFKIGSLVYSANYIFTGFITSISVYGTIGQEKYTYCIDNTYTTTEEKLRLVDGQVKIGDDWVRQRPDDSCQKCKESSLDGFHKGYKAAYEDMEAESPIRTGLITKEKLLAVGFIDNDSSILYKYGPSGKDSFVDTDVIVESFGRWMFNPGGSCHIGKWHSITTMGQLISKMANK